MTDPTSTDEPRDDGRAAPGDAREPVRDPRDGAGDGSEARRRPSRRTVVAAAAWSVPAIGLAVATPAHAASVGGLRVVVTVPRPTTRPVGSDLSDVTATLVDDAGRPVPSTRLRLLAFGAAEFADGAGTRTVTTNGAGVARFEQLVAASTPGVAAVRAETLTAPVVSDQREIEVVAVTTPSIIRFSPDSYSATAGTTFGAITGSVTADSTGSRPSSIALSYSGDSAGPDSTTVSPVSGAFSVSGVRAPATPGEGSVAASSPGATGDSARLTVTAVVLPGEAYVYYWPQYGLYYPIEPDGQYPRKQGEYSYAAAAARTTRWVVPPVGQRGRIVNAATGGVLGIGGPGVNSNAVHVGGGYADGWVLEADGVLRNPAFSASWGGGFRGVNATENFLLWCMPHLTPGGPARLVTRQQ